MIDRQSLFGRHTPSSCHGVARRAKTPGGQSAAFIRKKANLLKAFSGIVMTCL